MERSLILTIVYGALYVVMLLATSFFGFVETLDDFNKGTTGDRKPSTCSYLLFATLPINDMRNTSTMQSHF